MIVRPPRGAAAPRGGLPPTFFGAGGGGGPVLPTFNGRIGMVGHSQIVGASSFNATGQQDTSYGVEDVNGTGYAPVQIDAMYAQSILSPVVWLTPFAANHNLRGYDVPPTLCAGSEQSIGRRIVELGLHAGPKINKIGLSGSTTHTHWRTDSTFPLNGGLNLNAQAIAYLQAREIAMGGAHDVIVLGLGENDTGSSTNANPTAADLANVIGALRAGLGRPTQLVYLLICPSGAAGAFTATVRQGQLDYIASDPYCRGISQEGIPFGANPHWGFGGYITVGDLVVRQIQRDFFADAVVNRTPITNTPILADWGPATTIAASANGVVRPGSEERDGDLQLMAITGQSAVATHALTVAAGFTLIGSFESVFGGTNHRSMALYWRLVDAATVATPGNDNRMPYPTITAGAAQSSIAKIFTIRGPTKYTTNPIDLVRTGANNGNTTALSIATDLVGTGVTAAANELALIFASIPNTSITGPLVSSVTNAALTGLTIRQQPLSSQASFVGMLVATATVPVAGTNIGATSVVEGATGVNVGGVVVVKAAA